MSTRLLTDHILNGLNDHLKIEVIDEPGEGGANHRYNIDGPLQTIGTCSAPLFRTECRFQKGPIKEAGVNGISVESLIAVCIDRLRGFQYLRNPDGSYNFFERGKFNSYENQIALLCLESALAWLQRRTRDRMARGVEGTNVV